MVQERGIREVLVLIERTGNYHLDHHTTSDQMRSQLATAAEQLTQPAREREGKLLSAALSGSASPRSLSSLADLIPLILLKYNVRITRGTAVALDSPAASRSLLSSRWASALCLLAVGDPRPAQADVISATRFPGDAKRRDHRRSGGHASHLWPVVARRSRLSLVHPHARHPVPRGLARSEGLPISAMSWTSTTSTTIHDKGIPNDGPTLLA